MSSVSGTKRVPTFLSWRYHHEYIFNEFGLFELIINATQNDFLGSSHVKIGAMKKAMNGISFIPNWQSQVKNNPNPNFE